MKVLLLLVAGVMIGGCQTNTRMELGRPVALQHEPEEGPEHYRLGWRDGCNSALSSVNTGYALAVGTHRYVIRDVLWNGDEYYKTAWKDAYTFCVYYIFSQMMMRL